MFSENIINLTCCTIIKKPASRGDIFSAGRTKRRSPMLKESIYLFYKEYLIPTLRWTLSTPCLVYFIIRLTVHLCILWEGHTKDQLAVILVYNKLISIKITIIYSIEMDFQYLGMNKCVLNAHCSTSQKKYSQHGLHSSAHKYCSEWTILLFLWPSEY